MFFQNKKKIDPEVCFFKMFSTPDRHLRFVSLAFQKSTIEHASLSHAQKAISISRSDEKKTLN